LTSNEAQAVSAKINVVAATAVFLALAPGSTQSLRNDYLRADNQPKWSGNAISGAYAAANKSQRATRPVPRGSASQPNNPSIRHVIAPDGRDLGTDPDPTIRLQLQRDGGMRM